MASKKNYKELESVQVFVFSKEEILMVEEDVYATKRFTVPKRMVATNFSEIYSAIDVVQWETGVALREDEYIQELSGYDVCYSDGTRQNYKKRVRCFLFFTNNKTTSFVKGTGVYSVKYMHVSDFLKVCSFQNVSRLVMDCIKILNGKQLTNIALEGDGVTPDIYCDKVRNDLLDYVIKEINEIDACLVSGKPYNEDLIKDVFDFFENLDLSKLGLMSDAKFIEILNVCTGGMKELLLGTNFKRIFNLSGNVPSLFLTLYNLIKERRAKDDYKNPLADRCFVYLLVAIGAKKGILTARMIQNDAMDFYGYKAIHFEPFVSVRPVVKYCYLCDLYPELKDEATMVMLPLSIEYDNVYTLAFDEIGKEILGDSEE